MPGAREMERCRCRRAGEASAASDVHHGCLSERLDANQDGGEEGQGGGDRGQENGCDVLIGQHRLARQADREPRDDTGQGC